MRKYYNKFVLIILISSINILNAGTLSEDAIQRGINDTCASYLSQIEASYNISGLNITFAHPEQPSLYPSLHISSKKYNNGNSIFSATLSPNDNFCYISTVVTTSINNQSCNNIAELRVESDPSLQAVNYANNDYIILTPADNSFQTILTNAGDNSCTMTETRMLWPGR